ncbi:Ff.00g090440.m01.CDS01 [Fusarium sp. VM40]|nr:Ff.00g090440.m01.CDS01 [Fusarium sp. VM40]
MLLFISNTCPVGGAPKALQTVFQDLSAFLKAPDETKKAQRMRALKESFTKLENYQRDHGLIKFDFGPRPACPIGLDSRHFAKLRRIDNLLNRAQIHSELLVRLRKDVEIVLDDLAQIPVEDKQK